MKSQIICEIDENSTNCKLGITGRDVDLLTMTTCILKDVSATLNMPAEFVAILCPKNIDSVELVKPKENKPQADSDFNISLEDLQKLLNDIDGKEN